MADLVRQNRIEGQDPIVPMPQGKRDLGFRKIGALTRDTAKTGLS